MSKSQTSIDLIPDELPDPGTDPPPYCPVHFCLMKKYKTGKKARYYRCVVEGCQMRDTTARPNHPRVPDEPLWCLCCAADQRELVDGEIVTTPGRQVAMELVVSLSTATRLHFECLKCASIRRIDRPDLAAVMKRLQHRGRRDVLD